MALSAQRRECLQYTDAFRPYSAGVFRPQTAQGVKGSGVTLHCLGLSCGTMWLALVLDVDDKTGLVLTDDKLPAEGAQTLTELLEPITQAVEARLPVSGDDAGAFKAAADEPGSEWQVCKGHVRKKHGSAHQHPAMVARVGPD
jgi:hypothetical protein